MTHDFVFRAQAREDLRDAARFYEGGVAGLGAEFIAEVRTAVVQLRSHPEFAAGTRRKLLTRFPYGIIYLHENATLEIVAIVHNRREPHS